MSEHIAPHRLLGRIDASNRGGLILRRLCAYHPDPVSREDLMVGAGLLPRMMGGVSAYAAFHWWVCRINDDLASFGWSVSRAAGETYRLVRVG